MKADKVVTGDIQLLFEGGQPEILFSGVSVVISLYNYQETIIEALNSVLEQTLTGIELVVIDDSSTDLSRDLVQDWLSVNGKNFTRVFFAQHICNQGLAITRNTAIVNSQGKYFFVLDADNLMLPTCAARLKLALDEMHDYAFSYSIIAEFGDADGLFGTLKWSKDHLALGNYIDAMAMIRKISWKTVGGYKKLQGIGWEDYELWLNFSEHGYKGLWVPQILSRYRVHSKSMLRAVTKTKYHRKLLKKELKQLYPWVKIKH